MKTILSVLFFCAASVASADVEILNVNAEPISPWGKVYITYDVVGTLPECSNDVRIAVSVSNLVTHAVTYARTQSIVGETGFSVGRHRIIWDLANDNISCMDMRARFLVSYVHPLYWVVDIRNGTKADSYSVTPITTSADIPESGLTNDNFKTTKIVLRRIEPGTFVMGEDQSNARHCVTISKLFYLGIYEVTQRQWELVMGTNPSFANFGGSYKLLPVEQVSYDEIRGVSLGAQWPKSETVDADSFMGILRKKTGLGFDLPTEAQWEYACRAGTTTPYSYGSNADKNCMRYGWEYPPWLAWSVGSKNPNEWGLYDMHGNVSEWCADGFCTLSYGVDPKGFGDCRVVRGGGWECTDVAQCTSYYRGNSSSSDKSRSKGFRLLMTFSK